MSLDRRAEKNSLLVALLSEEVENRLCISVSTHDLLPSKVSTRSLIASFWLSMTSYAFENILHDSHGILHRVNRKWSIYDRRWLCSFGGVHTKKLGGERPYCLIESLVSILILCTFVTASRTSSEARTIPLRKYTSFSIIVLLEVYPRRWIESRNLTVMGCTEIANKYKY